MRASRPLRVSEQTRRFCGSLVEIDTGWKPCRCVCVLRRGGGEWVILKGTDGGLAAFPSAGSKIQLWGLRIIA